MSAGPEFLRWLGQALVVGFGWWVVHRLSASRDHEKARHELITKSADGLVDALNSLFSEVRDYHTGKRDVTRELRIKMTLQDMAMRTAGLSDICSEESILGACRADLAGLRKAISGEHFEDEHVEPLLESAKQFEVIAEAIQRVKRSFLKLKYRLYPRP